MCLYLKCEVASLKSTHRTLWAVALHLLEADVLLLQPSCPHLGLCSPQALGTCQPTGISVSWPLNAGRGGKKGWKQTVVCLYSTRSFPHPSGVECWCPLATSHRVLPTGKSVVLDGRVVCMWFPLGLGCRCPTRYFREVRLFRKANISSVNLVCMFQLISNSLLYPMLNIFASVAGRVSYVKHFVFSFEHERVQFIVLQRRSNRETFEEIK